ncbi:putative oxidoreductase [Muriicola jejuensis]|uniref:DoxX family membrane protein n=1 Tax=Muriicola jejuensis TaxID=504488 RepID=A0A6P0UDN6_9FLAO|nr:DoxX family protein [Muriicola jejuensis]NER09373.1 DoxX family membrane protein [Muriicola jejuensis]SMP09059.1 putative oxidoreductase [Muriicola jejuensis]
MKRLFRFYSTLNKPVLQRSTWAEVVLFFPRFICGMLLAIDFGASKFGVPWSPADRELGLFEVVYWFPEDVAQFGGIFAMFPVFFAWMAGFSETIGGLMLALGFKTRVAAFLILCTMLVAIFGQKWEEGLWGMLPAMGFLWVSLYTLVMGSGKFGLDFLFINKSPRFELVEE